MDGALVRLLRRERLTACLLPTPASAISGTIYANWASTVLCQLILRLPISKYEDDVGISQLSRAHS